MPTSNEKHAYVQNSVISPNIFELYQKCHIHLKSSDLTPPDELSITEILDLLSLKKTFTYEM